MAAVAMALLARLQHTNATAASRMVIHETSFCCKPLRRGLLHRRRDRCHRNRLTLGTNFTTQ